MRTKSERERLRQEHRGLRQQWANVYEDFGQPTDNDALPYYLCHRLAGIGGQMRQIEAELGEEIKAS